MKKMSDEEAIGWILGCGIYIMLVLLIESIVALALMTVVNYFAPIYDWPSITYGVTFALIFCVYIAYKAVKGLFNK